MVEEEKFFAWLDGEVAPHEAASIAAAVAGNPELSRLAEDHHAITAGLRRVFGTVEKQSLPEQFLREIEGGIDSNVIDIGEERAARNRRTQPLWVQAAAIAATLAVGIFTGNVLSGGTLGNRPSSPIEAKAGRVVAAADLEHALSTRLASAPADGGPRIGLTFREKSGSICRTFEVQSARGFACREADGWRIRSLFQAPDGQASGNQSMDYRMAGDELRLMETVDAAIDGEPFDATREKVALENRWK